MSFNSFLEKAIVKSQRCNRNWDLSKEVPEEDIKTLMTAVTQCSSKQNRVFYRCHFITDRSVIEQLYEKTAGFARNIDDPQNRTYRKNPQVLANLVVAFSEDMDVDEGLRTTEERDLGKIMSKEEAKKAGRTDQDLFTAVGIAAGYLTYTANLLGYSTGCCQCFDPKDIGDIIIAEKPILLMGIGYPGDKNRRIDHTDDNFMFPSFKKNIKVDYI